MHCGHLGNSALPVQTPQNTKLEPPFQNMFFLDDRVSWRLSQTDRQTETQSDTQEKKKRRREEEKDEAQDNTQDGK